MPSKTAGRVARLFVLGTLETHGPAHGHEIRLLAERIDVENWSEAQVGSIYNALRRLETEGLIEAVRTEQEGRRPTRTIFAITTPGRQELASLQDKLLHDIILPNDPFDVALWIAAQAPNQDLTGALEHRVKSLRELGERLTSERERLTSAGYLPPVGQLLFRHGELRIDAELRWHEELRIQLVQPSSETRPPDGSTSGPSAQAS